MTRLCIIAKAHSIHTQRWVCAFAQRPDYDVTLISPHHDHAFRSERFCGATVYNMAASPPPAKRRYAQVLRNYIQMRRLIQKERFDIVHIHQLPPTPMGYFFWRTPNLVVSTWGYDIVDYPGRPKSALRDHLRRFVLRQAVSVTATSQYQANITRTFTPSTTPIATIPFGVDTDLFHNVSAERPVPPPLRIIITKSLEPKYGVDILLHAFRRVIETNPYLELWIVGAGKERDALEALTTELDLKSQVVFWGKVEHSRLVEMMQRSHLAVMPSTDDSETFGVAAVEAQAMGLPVVASAVGGVPEVVRDGNTGLLVPPRDVDALTDALRTLIDNPQLRQQMGAAGVKWVEERYRWDTCVFQMDQVYRQVLGRN